MVCGFGPGISRAVAEKFGAEGFQVALVARNADRVREGASALQQRGVHAQGFPCDLSDPSALPLLVRQVREALGALHVLHWNAYSHAAGDLLTATPAELHETFNLSVVSLTAAVQACLPDLQQVDRPAILVTGGALSNYGSAVDERATKWGVMGLSMAKAAQHKTVGLLHAKLEPLGIFVGEVTVGAIVKGTAADRGQGTLEPEAVAARFWEQYQRRADAAVPIA